MTDYKNNLLDDIILLAPRNYPAESRRTIDMLKHGDPAVIDRWWDNIIHPIVKKHKQPEKYSRQYHLMMDEIIRELNAKSRVLSESQTTDMVVDQFREFLLFCKSELDLEKLPSISWFTHDDVGNDQPTFGSFHNEDQTIKIGINNRHILDVMRTLAHELCHFKQWTENRLDHNSGETGSNEENEANARAGVIMRKWNKAHPEMFAQKPIERKNMAEAGKRYRGTMVNKLKNPGLAMKRIKSNVVDEDDGENKKLSASERQKIADIQRDPEEIRRIKNPSEAVQLAAVEANGNLIYWIGNPSEAVQLAAVRQNGWAIDLIRDPSDAVFIEAIKQIPVVFIKYARFMPEKIQQMAKHGVNWPEILDKSKIIRALLKKVKDEPSSRDILGPIKLLRAVGIDWPELNVIDKSMSNVKRLPIAEKHSKYAISPESIKTDEDNEEVDSQEGVEEGWKSKVAGAALIGLGALGAAGHARADDQGAGAKAPTQTSQAAGDLQWLDDPSIPDNLPGKVAGSRFPTRAPVGTKYGSFINDKGEKINAYVDHELTSRFVPDKEGEWKPQSFPTNAPVGTKYGTFTDKDGKKWDKYVGHDLTSVFKPAN